MAARFVIDDVNEQRKRLNEIYARNESRADKRMAETPGTDLNRRPMMRVREDIPVRPGVDSYEVTGDDAQRVLNPGASQFTKISDGNQNGKYEDDGIGAYKEIMASRRRIMMDAAKPTITHESDLGSDRGRMGSADMMFRQNAGGTNQEQVRRQMDAGGYLDEIRRKRQLADQNSFYKQQRYLSRDQRDATVNAAKAEAEGVKAKADADLAGKKYEVDASFRQPVVAGNNAWAPNADGGFDPLAPAGAGNVPPAGFTVDDDTGFTVYHDGKGGTQVFAPKNGAKYTVDDLGFNAQFMDPVEVADLLQRMNATIQGGGGAKSSPSAEKKTPRERWGSK